MEEVNQDTQQPVQAPAVSDTPDNAFQNDTESGSTNDSFSFDDVIFGPEGERKPADPPPRTPEQVAADNVRQSEQPPQQDAQVEYQAKNDDKRFEYWQSQASKLQNENAQLKSGQQQIQQHLANQQQAQQQPRYTSGGPMLSQQPNALHPAQEEGFPPPPDKPDRPRNYSREAAYTDPASESSAYLDAVEDWRDNMDEYNQLKSEYETARLEEQQQAMEAQRQNVMRQQQATAEQQRQIGEIDQYVQAQYGLSANEAQEFIREYSDPKSVTMENLISLYRMKNGTPQAPVQPQGPPRPSPAFEQTARAQQVAPPMGVQSGVGNSNPVDARPDGQKFMDALIGSHNKNTAF